MLENKYDSRKNGSNVSKSISKLKKKNLGEEHRPAISQLNMHPHHAATLPKHPNSWSELGINEGTEKHLQIGRTLLELIWSQQYSGKVGFTL